MRTEENLIKGCESNAWLDWKSDAQQRLWFAADSDARVIRGLIALVFAALNGKQPQQILNFDMQQYFEQLQLIRHLSPSRGNGLKAIVDRIRAVAKQHG